MDFPILTGDPSRRRARPDDLSPKPHLLHVFPTFCAAGAQVRTTTLMRAFGERYRHSVVSCDGRTEAAGLARDVDLRLLPWAPAKGGTPAAVRFVRGLLRAESPDLLLTYNWGAMDAVLAARSLGFGALVHHEDGFNADEAEKLFARRNWTRRLALRKYEVIVPSRKLEVIAKKTWRLRHVHMIPNGVDARDFAGAGAEERASFRRAHGIAEGAFVVGAVGHLRAVKNFHRLIEAAARAPWPEGTEPHLVIVGDGEERAALERTAGAFDALPVTFAGHVEDLGPAYAAFDVFSLSSDSEQQPVSVLEAMAAGVPVVATDVGDVRATVPPEGGEFLSRLGPHAARDLGLAYARLAASPKIREALASAGEKRLVEAYSLDAMVTAYGRVYESARERAW